MDPRPVVEEPVADVSADAIPSEPFSTAEHRRILAGLLLIGLLARCVRYFLRFPLWEDECFLSVNFIDRGYADLLKPLAHGQVAPGLFLWTQLTIVKLLGFNEFTLRLSSFLCSLAGLLVFRHVAARLLTGVPQLLAVGCFAVAYPCIRYAAEAKQYGADMLIGLISLALAVEWWQANRDSRRVAILWILAAFTPLAVAMSLPAVFALGGVSGFVAVVFLNEFLRRTPQRANSFRDILGNRQVIGWGAFNLSLCICVLWLMKLANANANVAGMDQYWGNIFPPWKTPWQIPLWCLSIHTGDLLAFPIGGGRGASTGTFLAIVCGIAALAKRWNWALIGLLIAAPLLHLTASALHKYPYGGHVKLSMHMAGGICLLGGLGLGTVLTGLKLSLKTCRHVTASMCLGFAILGMASITRDILTPYKTESDQRARSFANWYWFNEGIQNELVDVEREFQQNFCPEIRTKLSWIAMFECNRQIYSPPKPELRQRLAAVSADHPLRCLVYRDPRYEFDQHAFDRWMGEMRTKYELIGKETIPFPRFNKREDRCVTTDYLDEYRFIPRPATRLASTAADTP